MSDIKAIDLFAGVGGISLGLKMAGINPVLSVEIDASCVEALKQNFPGKIVLDQDVKIVKGKDLLKRANIKELDVLAGGPPCQGFSLIGLRDPNDPRSGLVREFIRLAKEMKPKVIMMENVPGMLSSEKGKFFEEVLKQFDAIGYNIVTPVRVLNAAEFGVPQDRKRVIVIGTRKDLPKGFSYPNPTHFNPKNIGVIENINNLPITPTVMEAIADLPEIDKYEHLVEDDTVEYQSKPETEYAKVMRGVKKNTPFSVLPKNKWNSKFCTGCRRTVHGKVLTKRFKETKQGDTAPISRLYKLKANGIANTLRAGTPRERGAYSAPRPVHPFQPRVVSVREGARIQSFPDWHQFHKTKWHGFRQVGNAVPPLLAYAVATQIMSYLNSLED